MAIATRKEPPAEVGPQGDDRARARLFDAERNDRMLPFSEALDAKVSGQQLLWIDLSGESSPEAVASLVERFDLDSHAEEALRDAGEGPHLELHGKHFHVRVAAEPDAEHPDDVRWLDAIGGDNFVITRHAKPLDVVATINSQISTDASIAELDPAEFVAALLDSVITSYHAAIDRLEDELDTHDTLALAQEGANEGVDRLVNMRRRVGRLRRLYAAHRHVFASIGRTDFARGVGSHDPEVFAQLPGRFDSALASVEAARELVMSSFDVLMTRTAQRTNEVMRVLTLVTVLALPATVVAGLLGMNMIIPLPDDRPEAWWMVLGVLVFFEITILSVARWRRWI